MDTALIAKLLHPFLQADPSPCHFEAAKAGEACPEPSRREPAVLSPAQFHSISTYIDILLRWNARINLTAIRDPEDIIPRHFGESLFAARSLFPRASSESSVVNSLGLERSADPKRSAVSVADLGSGAGFPGLPIKLWAPLVSLTLIESNHKKATFLREVVRSLTLTGVNIKNARAQDVSQTFDLVTLRAVEDFNSILPIAATLVAPGGRLALLIGSSQVADALTVLPAFSWATPIPVPISRARVLLVSHPRTT